MSGLDLTCREMLDFLGAYLDGELAPRVLADFDHHLALCPACSRYLDTYRETIRLCRDACADDATLPEDVPEELVQAILASRRR